MRILELFSGTSSVGKVAKQLGYEVYSLDKFMDTKLSDKHFLLDIHDFNYKQFDKNYFDVISASPVCLWWSNARKCCFGREIKAHPNQLFSWDLYYQDIEDFGVPMVDKMFEILNYFEPRKWWIENPYTSDMKNYINDLIPFVDVAYCQYGFDYPKKTRLWVSESIKENFKPKFCDKNCKKKVNGKHIVEIEWLKGGNRSELRYRIPSQLIKDLLTC